MSWVLIFVATLLATEILWRLPLAKRWGTLQRTLKRVQPVIASPRISDHWKEKALQAYSGKIFVGSWFFLGCVALALVPFAIIVYLGKVMELPIEKQLLSVIGTISVMAVALAFWILRAKLSRKA